jgi:hypothetical protein
MRNSLVLWLVSGAVSVAVHAGALAALSFIPLPEAKDAAHTELLVASADLNDLFQRQISSSPPPAATAPEMPAEVLESRAPSSERIAAVTGEAVSAVKAATVERAPSPSLDARKSSSTGPLKPATMLGPYVAAEAPADTIGTLTPTAGSEVLASQSESLAPLAAAPELELAPTEPGAMLTPQAPAVTSNTLAPMAGSEVLASQRESLAPLTAAPELAPTGPGAMLTPQAPAVTSNTLAPMAGSEVLASQRESLAPLTAAPELAPTGPGAMLTPQAPAGAPSSPQVGAADSGEIVAADTGPVISSNLGSQPVVPAGQGSPVLSAQPPPESASAAGIHPKERVAALPGAILTTPEVSASSDAVLAPEAPPPARPAAPQPVLPGHDGTQAATATGSGSALLTQAERVLKFLEQDGDRPCVYAKPSNIEANRPSFTGFGGGRVRIQQFSEDFQRAVGVGPRLAMRPVMDAQCPAVDFIRSLRSLGASELAIIIDHQKIADFGNLIGHLEGEFDVHILLLLVDDDGAVQDLSGKLHRKGNVNVFAEPVRLRRQGRSRYQMLLAISTSTPLEAGATLTPGEAQQVFERLSVQTIGRNRITSWGISSFRVE